MKNLKRIPFTAVMLAALIVAGLYGQTHIGLLDGGVREDVGFSTHLLFRGQLHRIFTSLFFTAGGWRFYASLMMFAVAVGWVELVHGTHRAASTFLAIHVLTIVALSLLVTWPLAAIETHHGLAMFDARDVGPSAGYYGCLGLAVSRLGHRTRVSFIAAIIAVLVGRLVSSSIHLPEEGRMMLADLAHVLAFPLGIASARLGRHNDPVMSV